MEILSVEVIECESWKKVWTSEIRTFMLCRCSVEVINPDGLYMGEKPQIRVTGTPQQIHNAKSELYQQAA